MNETEFDPEVIHIVDHADRCRELVADGQQAGRIDIGQGRAGQRRPGIEAHIGQETHGHGPDARINRGRISADGENALRSAVGGVELIDGRVVGDHGGDAGDVSRRRILLDRRLLAGDLVLLLLVLAIEIDPVAGAERQLLQRVRLGRQGQGGCGGDDDRQRRKAQVGAGGGLGHGGLPAADREPSAAQCGWLAEGMEFTTHSTRRGSPKRPVLFENQLGTDARPTPGSSGHYPLRLTGSAVDPEVST